MSDERLLSRFCAPCHKIGTRQDWEGDPNVINGTRSWEEKYCIECGAEGEELDEACRDSEAEPEHDWRYDGGDASTGVNPAWICRRCGKVDELDREPPSDDDDIAF